MTFLGKVLAAVLHLHVFLCVSKAHTHAHTHTHTHTNTHTSTCTFLLFPFNEGRAWVLSHEYKIYSADFTDWMTLRYYYIRLLMARYEKLMIYMILMKNKCTDSE